MRRTAVLLAVYLLCACICLLPEGRLSPLFRGFTWVLRTVAAPATLLVMLLYWTTVFPSYWYTDVMDVHIHLVNAVIMLFDVYTCRTPFQLRHLPLSVIYVASYILFTAVYWRAHGMTEKGTPNIYPLLSWDKPLMTVPVIAFVLLVLLPVVHALLWLLDRLGWKSWGEAGRELRMEW